MIHVIRTIERSAAPAPDAASIRPPRMAGLPGADRRILRKRLGRPSKYSEKRFEELRRAPR